ncbi:hypothetical protein ACLB2K_066493 [Fragaria x ananassa]
MIVYYSCSTVILHNLLDYAETIRISVLCVDLHVLRNMVALGRWRVSCFVKPAQPPSGKMKLSVTVRDDYGDSSPWGVLVAAQNKEAVSHDSDISRMQLHLTAATTMVFLFHILAATVKESLG